MRFLIKLINYQNFGEIAHLRRRRETFISRSVLLLCIGNPFTWNHVFSFWLK